MDNFAEIPLVVDMDGTLIKTDMLFESANNFLLCHPHRAINIPGWLLKGKACLKARLAEGCQIDVALLPYNESLLDLLKHQKKSGRTIVLATASHRELAEKVARHLGLFAEVLATDSGNNLKSGCKRKMLSERYGEKAFDYIGNSRADFPVWEAAHKAYVVSSSPGFIKKVREINNLVEVISPERSPLVKTLFKASRAHQWVKNLLIFLPALAAHQLNNFSTIFNLLVAFAVFCLTASSVYILNDLIDLPHDRQHERKRHRPFASGNLSLLAGWMLWPFLLIIAGFIAIVMLPVSFSIVLAIYFVLTLAYSLWLKQIVIVDVMILAVLYTLRIIAGAQATDTPLSFWILSLSVFIFISLAFIKRFSELSFSSAGKDTRLKGRGYVSQDLEIISTMGIAAGYLAVLVLALYVQDPHTAKLYHRPKFIWLACPLLLYWISRAWILTIRGQMHYDPIIFAIRDRISWLVGICFAGVFALAMVGALNSA